MFPMTGPNKTRGRRAAGWLTLILAALVAAGVGAAWAEDIRYFRFGIGPSNSTSYKIGEIIAGAFSNPPGSRECEKGGSCGVPGLIAVSQSTVGSVGNVE